MKLKGYVCLGNEIFVIAKQLSYEVVFNGVAVEFFSYLDADNYFFDLISSLQSNVTVRAGTDAAMKLRAV